jgi:hypothetical protein
LAQSLDQNLVTQRLLAQLAAQRLTGQQLAAHGVTAQALAAQQLAQGFGTHPAGFGTQPLGPMHGLGANFPDHGARSQQELLAAAQLQQKQARNQFLAGGHPNSTALALAARLQQSTNAAHSDDLNDDLFEMPLRVEGGLTGNRLQNSQLAPPELLFEAVTRNDVKAISELLQAGADINSFTEHGSHIIFRAVIKAQDATMVRFLIEGKADVQAMDPKGNSVMHFWARATVGRNHLLEIGEALVQAGARVDAQRIADGMSPLHHVAIGHNNRRGWLDFHKALFLLRHGASIDILTHRGQRPLDLLTKDGRTSTKKMVPLLQFGINSMSYPRCEHPGCLWCS